MRYVQVLIVFIAIVLLTGCDKQLLVRDTTADQLVPILKDYAGINGYSVSYANDQTKSYRLELGSVYIPASSQTEVTKITLPTENIQPLATYEQRTWKTVSALDRTVAVAVMVRILPKNGDVIVKLSSDAEPGTLGRQVAKLKEYLLDYGFIVEDK